MKFKRKKSGGKLRFSTDNIQITKSSRNDSFSPTNVQCKPEKIKEFDAKI